MGIILLIVYGPRCLAIFYEVRAYSLATTCILPLAASYNDSQKVGVVVHIITENTDN